MQDIQNKKQVGLAFEQQAYLFLKENGLTLITKNYRCLYGEIDLIMQDNDEIVFVEVRMRINSEYGSAIDSVTCHKQKKLLKAATYFLQQKNLIDKVNCRFDVIGFSNHSVEWIRDAFSYE